MSGHVINILLVNHRFNDTRDSISDVDLEVRKFLENESVSSNGSLCSFYPPISPTGADSLAAGKFRDEQSTWHNIPPPTMIAYLMNGL